MRVQAWHGLRNNCRIKRTIMSIATEKIVEPPEVRMVLDNISWSTFVELAEQRRGSVPRMTYDEGTLELMNPKRKHENIGRLIGRMIETYSEIRGLEIISVASVTVKRDDLEKAYEADESYYVTHAEALLEKEELDFATDPAPDLVVEVELTSSSIARLKLFARMEVPEVWRHRGKTIEMFRLIQGEYVSIDSSVELPGLQVSVINDFLSRPNAIGETKLMLSFREFIQTISR